MGPISVIGRRVLPALVLLCLALAAPQDPPREYDLTWKLPHDHAAVYDVYDGMKGTRLGEFWLLGCETQGQIGANGGSELPLRFLFRSPKQRVKAGSQWEIKETAFGNTQGLMAPVEVTGAYRVKQIKKARLEEVFKASTRERKEKSEPIDSVLIEGLAEFLRCNWVNGKVVVADRKPSATLTTAVLVRSSDGALIGARYRLAGKVQDFSKMGSGELPNTVDETKEFLIREPLVELSRTALKSRIDQAVERGVKWLKAQQAGDGSISDRTGYPIGTSGGVGATSLCLLALLHSGVSPKDVRTGFNYISGKRLNQSYDLSLYLMALEAKYLPLEKFEDIEKFSEDKARDHIASQITKEDKASAAEAARLLMECQGQHGSFGYTKGVDEPNLSNTQYALLGLKSASRMGVPIPPTVWQRAFVAIEQAAVLNGNDLEVDVKWLGGKEERRKVYPQSWAYYWPKVGKYSEVLQSTMVTAALCSVTICRSELVRLKAWDDRWEKRAEGLEWAAIAWLRTTFGMRASKPEGAWWGPAMVYYFLYGLERAGILAGIDRIAGHDWHLEGVGVLLSWQKADGRWEGPQGTPVVDTAFALLFLKRATVPVETPARRSAVDKTEEKEEKQNSNK